MTKWAIITAMFAASATLVSTGAYAGPHDRGQRWEQGKRNHKWDNNDRRGNAHWNNGRNSNQRAYMQGYRAGARTDNRRVVVRQPHYRGPTYSTNQRYYNNNVRYANNNGRYWWGDNGRMHCRRDDGTTGLIVGAVGGGVLGNMIAGQGDKLLGSVIGGALGAVLGKEIDSGNVRCR